MLFSESFGLSFLSFLCHLCCYVGCRFFLPCVSLFFVIWGAMLPYKLSKMKEKWEIWWIILRKNIDISPCFIMFPTLGGRNMKKRRFFLRNNYQIERNTYQKKTRRRQQKHDIWKKQWQTKWQRKWQKKTDKIIIWSTPSVWLQESSKSTQS
jgi:hypothetical protein